MSVTFIITKVSNMPSANILGTLSAGSPPVGGKSIITVVETTTDGIVGSAATYTVNSPDTSFSFTAGIGSKLDATQVDYNAEGIPSRPTVTPTFLVVDPSPPAPGAITFTVTGVNP